MPAPESKVGIIGSGSFMPETVIPNARIASLIRQESHGSAWAKEKLGIEERRFATDLDIDGRPTQDIDELSMATEAAQAALRNAAVRPEDVGGIWYVSCTQNELRRHFSRAVNDLHAALGLRPEAVALEMDAGCGGALHAIAHSKAMLRGNGHDSMLVVASNMPSQYYKSWHAYVSSDRWLPMYIFGDGAGAFLLKRYSDPNEYLGAEIIAEYTASDPTQPLMFYQPRGNDPTPLFDIDGRAVATGFARYCAKALYELRRKCAFEYSDIARFYFHQVNGRVLDKFVESQKIPKEKVAKHVDRYGNIAAAATLVLFDEDRRSGEIQPGELVVFCTVGAGAQYGAMLVRV